MDDIQVRNSPMVEQMMRLHKCADCPIRHRAAKEPRSIFGRIHRWHMTWWPGYKIYQREQRACVARATVEV